MAGDEVTIQTLDMPYGGVFFLTEEQQQAAQKAGLSYVEFAHSMITATLKGRSPADFFATPAHNRMKGQLMNSIDKMSLPQLIAFEVKVRAEMAKKRDAERKRLRDEMAAMAKAAGFELRGLFK